MPSLFIYPLRAIKYRYQKNNLIIPKNIDCLVNSPGGCGSVNFLVYIEKYIKSNIFFEKKYKIVTSGHLFKPPKSFIKNKVKMIIIKRDLNEIYHSMEKRGFLKNSLNMFGDYFPFIYINIFKDKAKLKKKYIKYIKKFYKNWESYPKDLKLVINYKDLYKNKKTKYLIYKFLNLKNNLFLKNFPKYSKYKKDNILWDPSTIWSYKIYGKK